MNEIIITLRNGRKLAATEVSEGLYSARLANGKIKEYPIAQLLGVEVIPSDEGVNTPLESESTAIKGKEKNHTMYHYLLQTLADPEDPKSKRIQRFVSDVLPSSRKVQYEESVKTHRPSGNVMAITTGGWHFSLMEWNIIRTGKNYTLMVVANEDLSLFKPEEIERWTDNSVFAYANASFSSFFSVSGTTEWGLDDYGLSMDFAPKSAKRAQEIARLTEMNLSVDMDSVKWRFSDTMETLPDSYGDGITVISRSFAVRMARTIQDKRKRAIQVRRYRAGIDVRGTLRMLVNGSLIKSHYIVVPDRQIDCEMIVHHKNLKAELGTTLDIAHITIWNSEVLHFAVWDEQSVVNFGVALPESKQIADINRLVANLEASLRNGEMPAWLLLGERDRNEDGSPNLERLSDSINRQWVYVQSKQLPVTMLQNLVKMGIGGVINRMKAMGTETVTLNGKMETYYKKMWIPMTNAISAYVMTREAAEIMGGYSFPDRNYAHTFFDHRVGLVIPGVRFEQTFNLHGTWDLDDTVKAIVIKLWASADIEVHRGSTIPEQMVVPTTEAEATECLLLVRSPNGPGEYSIERADFRGMFSDPELAQLVDFDNITVVDLSKMPLPQHVMLQNVTVNELPTSTDYRGGNTPMTRDDAKAMIKAQMANPSVGAYCNAMILWASVADGFPPEIADVMGNIVDAIQQGFDEVTFAAIKQETKNIYNQLVAYMKRNPRIVMDQSLAATRMPLPQMKRIINQLGEGRHYRVQKAYFAAINKMDSMVLHTSKMWRRETAIVQEIKLNHPIPMEFARWSEQFYTEFDARMKLADATHRVPKDADPFTKMNIQHGHKLAMEAVVADMVAIFESIKDLPQRHLLALGLYKWIVLMPQPRFARTPELDLGRVDRIIAQPGAAGTKSMLHILIDALEHFGLA